MIATYFSRELRHYESGIVRCAPAPRAATSAQDTASLIAIVVASAFVIGIAFLQHWPLRTLLWPCWIESVIIWILVLFGILKNAAEIFGSRAERKMLAKIKGRARQYLR